MLRWVAQTQALLSATSVVLQPYLGNFRDFPDISVSRSGPVDRADFRCRRLPRPPLRVVVLGDATEV